MLQKNENGYAVLSIKGRDVVFSTKPQAVYTVNDMVTDALAVTIEGSRTFLALCTVFMVDGELVLKSAEPVTCELFPGGMKYYRSTEGEIMVRTTSKPDAVSVNGVKTTGFRYEDDSNVLTVNLPAGEGVVLFQ